MVQADATTDDPPRARARIVRPEVLVPGVLGVASLATVRLVDPNVPGTYPVCPSIQLVGVLCPLCGGLRSTHALLSGDLVTAVQMNVLVVVGVLLAAALVVRRLRRPEAPPLRPPRALVVAGLVAVAAFAVARNVVDLPFGPVV